MKPDHTPQKPNDSPNRAKWIEQYEEQSLKFCNGKVEEQAVRTLFTGSEIIDLAALERLHFSRPALFEYDPVSTAERILDQSEQELQVEVQNLYCNGQNTLTADQLKFGDALIQPPEFDTDSIKIAYVLRSHPKGNLFLFRPGTDVPLGFLQTDSGFTKPAHQHVQSTHISQLRSSNSHFAPSLIIRTPLTAFDGTPLHKALANFRTREVQNDYNLIVGRIISEALGTTESSRIVQQSLLQNRAKSLTATLQTPQMSPLESIATFRHTIIEKPYRQRMLGENEHPYVTQKLRNMGEIKAIQDLTSTLPYTDFKMIHREDSSIFEYSRFTVSYEMSPIIPHPLKTRLSNIEILKGFNCSATQWSKQIESAVTLASHMMKLQSLAALYTSISNYRLSI